MKVTVNKAEIVDYKLVFRARNKEDEVLEIIIDTTNRENFLYIKEKLQKFPWTRSCRTWGEVISKLPNKTIDIRNSFIIRKVA